MDWLETLGWHDTQINDLRSLGYSYVKQGSYTTALTFFEALTILAPFNAYDLEVLGALHLQMGNGMKALETFDNVIKLEPASLEAKLNRAKALFMLGYRRQGLLQAMELAKSEDASIASQADALILAYK